MKTHGETGRGGWSCQPIQTDHTARRGAGLPGQMVHMAACRELNFCQKLGVEYLSLLILHKSCPYYYSPCSIDVISRLNMQIHQYLSIVYFCFMQCFFFFFQIPTVEHIKTRYFGIQKNIVSQNLSRSRYILDILPDLIIYDIKREVIVTSIVRLSSISSIYAIAPKKSWSKYLELVHNGLYSYVRCLNVNQLLIPDKQDYNASQGKGPPTHLGMGLLFTVGLDDLRVLFRHKRFYDSMSRFCEHLEFLCQASYQE